MNRIFKADLALSLVILQVWCPHHLALSLSRTGSGFVQETCADGVFFKILLIQPASFCRITESCQGARDCAFLFFFCSHSLLACCSLCLSTDCVDSTTHIAILRHSKVPTVKPRIQLTESERRYRGSFSRDRTTWEQLMEKRQRPAGFLSHLFWWLIPGVRLYSI